MKAVRYKIVSLVVIFLCVISPNVSRALECPPAPEAVSKDIKVETSAEIGRIAGLKGAELRNSTERIAKNLLDKTPNADRVYVAQLLTSVFCGMVNDSKEMTDKEKFSEFKEFQIRIQRLLLGSNKTAEQSNQTRVSSAANLHFPAAHESSIDELRERRLVPEYGWEDSDEWVLVLNVKSRFLSAQYSADLPALRSASEIRFQHDVLVGDRDNHQNRTNSISIDLRVGSNDGPPATPYILTDNLELEFKKKPDLHTKLLLSYGSSTTSIDIPEIKWSQAHYTYNATSKIFHYAQGDLSIEMADPTWPVIRSARLLGTMSAGTSLLEINIDNLAPTPLTIDNVYFRAIHPSNSGLSCAYPDIFQDVGFTWESTAEQSDGKGWTVLGTERVPISAQVRPYGKCEDFQLRALIPVSKSIDGNRSGKLLFRILELPHMGRNPIQDAPDFRTGDVPPSHLMAAVAKAKAVDPAAGLEDLGNWLHVVVGLNATKGSLAVFPSLIEVDTRIASVQDVEVDKNGSGERGDDVKH